MKDLPLASEMERRKACWAPKREILVQEEARRKSAVRRRLLLEKACQRGAMHLGQGQRLVQLEGVRHRASSPLVQLVLSLVLVRQQEQSVLELLLQLLQLLWLERHTLAHFEALAVLFEPSELVQAQVPHSSKIAGVLLA